MTKSVYVLTKVAKRNQNHITSVEVAANHSMQNAREKGTIYKAVTPPCGFSLQHVVQDNNVSSIGGFCLCYVSD